MNRNQFSRMLFCVCVSFAISLSPVQGDEEETIQFHYNYKAAVKEAKETGRPIFLEFRCAP